MPKGERRQNANEKYCRAASVADADRTLEEIGHCRADRGRRDDREPMNPRVEFLRRDLRDLRSNEDHEKYSCADQITSIFGIGIGMQHRYGDGVSTRLPERRGQHLDYPKEQCDRRNFAQGSLE